MKLEIKREMQKLKSYLENSKNILLVNHMRMDGDAYGSLLGFYHILKKIGDYNILCLNEDLTPESFYFLNEKEVFSTQMKDFVPDLIITFDVGGINRLGSVYEKNLNIFQNTTWINIDHHTSNDFFGNINIVDEKSSSTCEIVWDIIKEFSFEKYVDERISSFLLTGIITDTNSFFNTNTSPKALLSASELMNYNPCHQEIIINLFKKKSFNKLKLWGKVLESLKDIEKSQIVWNVVPKSFFIQTGTINKDLSGLISEFIMSIDRVKVGFLLYELEGKKIKGSFRAKTNDIDLSKFCEKWGGGGHDRASGFIIEDKNIYEVEQEIIEELKKIF